jgi:hypothetical protein
MALLMLQLPMLPPLYCTAPQNQNSPARASCASDFEITPL